MLFYWLLLLLLLLLLLYTFLFHDLKALNKKKKSKIKKNRSPDPAILGRVRTRDPDPGHFGPDFDSRSGHGYAFTDPRTGCLPEEHGRLDFWTVFGLF